jgi:hypothetical protein
VAPAAVTFTHVRSAVVTVAVGGENLGGSTVTFNATENKSLARPVEKVQPMAFKDG